MEKCPLSRDFRLKLRKTPLLKMSAKCFIVNVLLYIYIFSIGGRMGKLWGGWLNRDKENEDARKPSFYAFSFGHHMHMPIKPETRKGLLPNKNHVCETYFKL